MNQRIPTWIVTLAMVCVGAGRAPAEPAKPSAGDRPALPVGAIARLGDARFRHGDKVRCVAFSPDGKLLASGGAGKDGTIRFWDVATGREMRRIPGGQGSVASVAFSPDGRLLASGGGRETALCLWDVATGAMVRQMRLSPQWASVYKVAFTPDGTALATGNVNSTISFWNPEAAQETAQLEPSGDAGTSLDFSPDGRMMLSWGSFSKTVRMWDVTAGKESYDLDRKDVSTPAVFAPDGHTFAAGCTDGTIRLWSSVMGKEVGTLHGHSDLVTAVVFSPDGKRIISASRDKTIKVWDLATGTESRRTEVDTPPASVVLSPDGHTVAVRIRESSIIRLWDAETGRWLFGDGEDGLPWTQMAVAPDGRLLATARWMKLEVWDLATYKPVRAFHVDIGSRELAFSHDGKRVSARRVRGLSPLKHETTVRAWDVTGDKDTLRYRDMNHGGLLSPDGETLALWDHKKPVVLRSLATDESRELAAAAPTWKLAAVFSDDARLFALAWPGGDVHIWDVATAATVATVPTDMKHIRAMALSPGGDTLACTAAVGKTKGPAAISLFDVRAGQLLRTLDGHTAEVRLLKYASDGRILSSGGLDQTIRCWNLMTGDEIQKYRDVGNTPVSMAFSRDGKSLITGMSGGGAFVWSLPGGSRAASPKVHD